ncbi:MAG: aminotransferase class I/II-fold pyridoxal phosphate-dependent enzyme [Solirubrobacterales bacterium]|nr:aminotransferase class I/II-fold pyridoxal phosphate-dependent enzyme [Solirubrobacterales bacterium]
MSLTVVIGGTRSGKSAHAEALASATGLPVRYVATADGGDASMRARIDAHTARRPEAWTTVQASPALADALGDAAAMCVLLDGLGAWIATQLHLAGAFDDAAVLSSVTAQVLGDVDRAVAALDGAAAAIVVAEQAGEGVLPIDAASRAWVDLLGEATQRFAARADRVELVVAGRAVRLDALANGATSFVGPSGGAGSTLPVGGGSAGGATSFVGPPGSAGSTSHGLRRHGDRDVRPGDADHAVNVVAGGPPAWLRAALDEALDADAHRYPREDDAVAALATLHGRDPAEIVPTNGGAEALWLLGPALTPTLAACVHPAFTESEAALRAHGIAVVRVHRDPGRGFALDPTQVPEAADLVIVGNPASPSGTLDPVTAILALRRPGRTIVVDEAFMDLVPGEPGSLVRDPLEDVIVVRSLTKALSVPGLRVGYAVAPVALADRLRAVRPPWSVNVLALAALIASAAHLGELAAIAERAASERQDLTARLRAIDGVRVWPAAANFVLIEVADGPAVVAALRAEAIAVRPAASFPGLDDRHIRITARDAQQNTRLAAALTLAVLGVPA